MHPRVGAIVVVIMLNLQLTTLKLLGTGRKRRRGLALDEGGESLPASDRIVRNQMLLDIQRPLLWQLAPTACWCGLR